jgi:pyridoxamine 5'-phosphate oxidase
MPKTEPVPGWYDDLDETLAEAWRLLARGAADRRSGFHTPVAASLGRDGRPRARVVVLRAADPQDWILRFHTDRRSEKFSGLLADPRIALSGYDAGNKVQMRVEGRAILHTDDAVAEAAWIGSREMSRAVYGILPGPGRELANADEFTMPGQPDEIAAGRQNFCVVIVRMESLEWLYLASAGHRRALFERSGRAVTSSWLAP